MMVVRLRLLYLDLKAEVMGAVEVGVAGHGEE